MKQLTKFTAYKHSANAGDIIASLAGVKHLAEVKGKEAIYYQRLNVEAEYYMGAVHPTKDSNGVQVSMNEKMFEMIKPLIMAQPYIKDFKAWGGEEVDIDLDDIRKYRVNLPHGAIQRWYFYVYPQLSCDLSEQWLFPTQIMGGYEDKIFINRTQRYRNPQITYFFLKDYQEQLIFTGTKEEHEIFCKEWKLNIPLIEVNDFLELANILASCKFFIGNQSFVYNMCEAMKVPRILEICSYAQNCIPFGSDGYDFHHQAPLEYFVKTLNEK